MTFDFSNLSPVISQLSKDKGIQSSAVIDSVIQGVLAAVRKKYGTYRDIEVKYNKDLGELELFEFKTVVDDDKFEDELIEIKYSQAKELDPDTRHGDQIGTRLELKTLGRIDAQLAKQIIIQNLRHIEQDKIFSEFEKRKGEIANGIVRRVDPGMIVVSLEKTEAYIPRKEQIPGEKYKSGDRIQGYLLEVRQTTKGPQIIMSRTHEQYLIKLFESEVPEVYEGIVKIVAAAREPGQRAKMAVYSTDPAVHPVGSCVGIKGSRIQNITQELRGERIDVLIWEKDPVQFVCNALAPAKILKILMDEQKKQMQIIVPDEELSLAIGKKGQNVRLAVKLTGWHLDLVSESESKRAKKEALFNLSLLPNISESKAQNLVQYGYSHVTQLAETNPLSLQSVPEIKSEEEAIKLVQQAKDMVEKYKKEGKEFPKLKDVPVDKKPLASTLKEKAEEILKKELAQLEENKALEQNSGSKPLTKEKDIIEEKTLDKNLNESSTVAASTVKVEKKEDNKKTKKQISVKQEEKHVGNTTDQEEKHAIDNTKKTSPKVVTQSVQQNQLKKTVSENPTATKVSQQKEEKKKSSDNKKD